MPNGFAGRLSENIGRAVLGKQDAIELTVVTLVAGGHLLIEDRPGVGKTLLARALARSLGLPLIEAIDEIVDDGSCNAPTDFHESKYRKSDHHGFNTDK